MVAKLFFLTLNGLMSAVAIGVGAHIMNGGDSSGGIFVFLGSALAVLSWKSQ